MAMKQGTNRATRVEWLMKRRQGYRQRKGIISLSAVTTPLIALLACFILCALGNDIPALVSHVNSGKSIFFPNIPDINIFWLVPRELNFISITMGNVIDIVIFIYIFLTIGIVPYRCHKMYQEATIPFNDYRLVGHPGNNLPFLVDSISWFEDPREQERVNMSLDQVDQAKHVNVLHGLRVRCSTVVPSRVSPARSDTRFAIDKEGHLFAPFQDPRTCSLGNPRCSFSRQGFTTFRSRVFYLPFVFQVFPGSKISSRIKQIRRG
jgi:hypothetical protein